MTISLTLTLALLTAALPASHSSAVSEAELYERAGDDEARALRLERAYFEYVRAYRLLLYPVKDYAAREVLRAKIAGTLDTLYTNTQAHRYLCESWSFHDAHVRTLRRAGVAAEEVDGVVQVQRGVEAKIERVRQLGVERACAAGSSPRSLRRIGFSLLFVGALGAGAATYSAAMFAADVRYARALRVEYAGHEPTTIERELDEHLQARGELHRDVAIVSGVVGGLALIAGAVLVRAARDLPLGRGLALLPGIARGGVTVGVRVKF